MHARGCETEYPVAGGDVLARQQVSAFRCPDGETREIVVPIAVHSRHFCRLAANQRAAGLAASFGDTADDIGRGVGVEPAGGEIIEEKEGFRSLDH